MIIRVTDPTHAAEARRHAAACAEQVNLGARESGSLAIAVTEMATNLVKHAGTGSIVLEPVAENGSMGVRVLGLDKGPGMRNLAGAFRDGYSTSGTAGNGLGAIRRLSNAFDIYTRPGLGTAILAEFWPPRKGGQHTPGLQVGGLSVPVRGEEVCGDGWGTRNTASSVLLMVVDGLGHGILASEAAREAERVLRDSRSESPAAIIQDAHKALKKTRGAAMAVAALDTERQVVSFAGIGNVGASVVAPGRSGGLASHNGIVGHVMDKIQEFALPWSSESILVMYSDGLKSGWDLDAYPGIWSKHPGLIAGLLYRDFSRERDDVTILIAKNPAEATEQ